MRKAGGGVIINLGSLSSIRHGAGQPGYAVGKTGLIGLTRSAAASYAQDNIRCVLVSPGHVDTPFIRGNNPYSPNDASTSIDNPDNYERRLPGDAARAAPDGGGHREDDAVRGLGRRRDDHRLDDHGRRRRRPVAISPDNLTNTPTTG